MKYFVVTDEFEMHARLYGGYPDSVELPDIAAEIADDFAARIESACEVLGYDSPHYDKIIYYCESICGSPAVDLRLVDSSNNEFLFIMMREVAPEMPVRSAAHRSYDGYLIALGGHPTDTAS